jgi:hypothetical protein
LGVHSAFAHPPPHPHSLLYPKCDPTAQIKKENEGDEDLGSDLDDEEGEEPDTDNIALCQFEKVLP